MGSRLLVEDNLPPGEMPDPLGGAGFLLDERPAQTPRSKNERRERHDLCRCRGLEATTWPSRSVRGPGDRLRATREAQLPGALVFPDHACDLATFVDSGRGSPELADCRTTGVFHKVADGRAGTLTREPETNLLRNADERP
jgi:hypothetical protein